LRGNGWAAAAIVDILAELGERDPRRDELERVLGRLAQGLAVRQRPDGPTNAQPALLYRLVPRVRDASYGVGSLLLAAAAV
jgi:hypothetical protein